jgi:hypothetical protein
VLRWVDVLTHYRNRTLVLLKLLDSPAGDVIALLDWPTIDGRITIGRPYRLVLDLVADGQSRLFLRGGHRARLDDLPFGADLAGEVIGWNQRTVAQLQHEPDPEAAGRISRTAAAEGRALAARVQAALGPGARVLVSGDVPTWTWCGVEQR